VFYLFYLLQFSIIAPLEHCPALEPRNINEISLQDFDRFVERGRSVFESVFLFLEKLLVC